MSENDRLLSLIFEGFPVRGALVRLGPSWQSVRHRNPSPDPVQELLGQALAAVALLTSNIKFDGQVTLQLQGEGPVRLMLTQCTDAGGLRGIVRSHAEAPVGASFGDLTQDAVLTVSIEQRGGQRYQGIVPINGDNLAGALEGYFRQSEQLETQLRLACDDQRVAGLLLQRMPDDGGSIVDPDGWTRVTHLADTLSPSELLNLSSEEVAHRLFHEERVSAEAIDMTFSCPCSRERVAQVLDSIGRDEMIRALGSEDQITVDCEFCNERYEFDRVDLEVLFNSNSMDGPGQTRQ